MHFNNKYTLQAISSLYIRQLTSQRRLKADSYETSPGQRRLQHKLYKEISQD